MRQGVKHEAQTSFCSRLAEQPWEHIWKTHSRGSCDNPPGLGEANTWLPRSKQLCLGHCHFLVAADMFFWILDIWPGGKPALKVHWLFTELHLPYDCPENSPDRLQSRIRHLVVISYVAYSGFPLCDAEIVGVICFNVYFFFFAH